MLTQGSDLGHLVIASHPKRQRKGRVREGATECRMVVILHQMGGVSMEAGQLEAREMKLQSLTGYSPKGQYGGVGPPISHAPHKGTQRGYGS